MRTLTLLVAMALSGCGKAPQRTDYEVKNYEGDETAVMVALGNSDARWCDLFYTFRHKADPDKVLIECHPYKKPVEYWTWTRGSFYASKHGEM